MTSGRALQASPEGIKKARRALRQHSLTQKALAEEELKIKLQTVDNFFKCQPIYCTYFYQICQRLNLEWNDIVATPSKPETEATQYHRCDIDALVQVVREKVRTSIVMQCGTMRVLNMTQPIELSDIYTDVNILEKIAKSRRLEIAELLQGFDPETEDFDRCGLGRFEQRVPGLKVVNDYPKLMVLGKPGTGKTTFLKYLAIQCSRGELLFDRVPIFISLKQFAETRKQPQLLAFITEMFANCGVTHNQTSEVINSGRALILLDGLDEVRLEETHWVFTSIRDFSVRYKQNQFIITCRISAREYCFDKFTEVEIADFNDKQIVTFANKWFAPKNPTTGNRFIQKLKTSNSIRELANNPLLLTLLCLVFEESVDFPANRSELYQEGLNILLKKWDVYRNIERQQVYKKLSVQQKQDLLGYIARITFERGDYFFKQKEVELLISDYICNLPGVSSDFEALQLDSMAVLKCIEAQHGLLVERAKGIYSFSHLTFQEYFTAKEIVAGSDPQALEAALQQLAGRVTEKRWREVFLLTVSMLRNADYLLQLMKQQIDDLVAQDAQLPELLNWVSKKSLSVVAECKPVIVRAFYLDLALGLACADRTLALTLSLDSNLARVLTLDSAIDFDRAIDRTLVLTLDCARVIERDLALTLELDIELNPIRALTLMLNRALDRTHAFYSKLEDKPKLSPLGKSLQQLKKQLANLDEDKQTVAAWWKANGGAWTLALRTVMIEHRNIGRDWQFSEQQMEVLKYYYSANELLVDCLNSNCYVTREVRSQIENTLLLPPCLASVKLCI